MGWLPWIDLWGKCADGWDDGCVSTPVEVGWEGLVKGRFGAVLVEKPFHKIRWARL